MTKEECLVSRRKRRFDERSEKGKVLYVLKAIGTFNGQFVEVYRTKGTDGQKGGNRGRPGIGGKGAKSGRISISENSSIFLKTAKKGNNGRNGNFGESGEDGSHGKDWYGEYINELPFASLRRKIKHEQNSDEEDKQDSNDSNDQDKGIDIDGQDAYNIAGGATRAVTGGVSLIPVGSELAITGTITTARASLGVAGAVIGLGTLAVQAIASPISAHRSSKWKVEPELRDREGQDEIDKSEDEAEEYNQEGLMNPEEGFDYEPDLAEFENFKSEFIQEMTQIVGENEAQKWLE